MEQIYTIRVKRPVDPRELYPSERRYSASTVRGLACLHLAVAVLTALLAALALRPIPLQTPSWASKTTEATWPDKQSTPITGRNINSEENFTQPSAPNDASAMLTSVAIENVEENDSGVTVDEVIDFNTSNAEVTSSTSQPSYDAQRNPFLVTAGGEIYAEATSDDEKVLYNESKGYEVPPDVDAMQPAALTSDDNSTLDDEVSAVREDNFTNSYLVGAAALVLSVGALLAGLAALRASYRWYENNPIAWFLAASVISTLCGLFSATIAALELLPLITEPNCSLLEHATGALQDDGSYILTIPGEYVRLSMHHRSVSKSLLLNILLASVLEVVWSVLSACLSWRGARARDWEGPGGAAAAGGPALQVCSQVKGTHAKRLPHNTKIMPPQPDLIHHHPTHDKIDKYFKSQRSRGGVFVRAEGGGVLGSRLAGEQGGDSGESPQEHRERVLAFLRDGGPPEQPQEQPPEAPTPPSPAPSWGDPPVYSQDTLDLKAIARGMLHIKDEAAEAQDAR